MITRLQYRRGLGYIGARHLPKIPADLIQSVKGKSVITFRKPLANSADRVIRNVSALTKLDRIVGTDVVFIGVQNDSPLAPILIWDVAHALPVGGRITFIGDLVERHQLQRDYYAGAFVLEASSLGVAFRKVSKLDAEMSSIDEWTFGIPTGPEDATLLNACVKRILELDIPKKEILLCGRPGTNFKYLDKVRIVGEDITAPPVQITKKKNRLAQEAKYDNLCIIHDRVFLPKNFMESVRKFGNAYPLTGFQSIFFDDKLNMVPRRYSDFGMANKLSGQTNLGLMRSDEIQPSKYSPTVFPLIEKSEFLFANPHRLTRNTYPTGSLYMCKKSVWLRCPQNESLNWIEFEDVEHAERAFEMGIPSRVNPYGISQSMISRPLLSVLGASHIELKNGMSGLYRSVFEPLPLPRKPLIKKTQEKAALDAFAFVRKYAPEVDIPSLSASAQNHRMRLRMIARALNGVRLPLHKPTIRQFMADYEKLIVADQLPYGWHEAMAEHFYYGGRNALQEFLERSPTLLNHVGQRPRRGIFAETLKDYLPKDGFAIRLGSLVSAIGLWAQNHRAFAFPGGILWRYRQIVDSTPFIHYAED